MRPSSARSAMAAIVIASKVRSAISSANASKTRRCSCSRCCWRVSPEMRGTGRRLALLRSQVSLYSTAGASRRGRLLGPRPGALIGVACVRISDPRDDPTEQLAHPGGRGAPGLEHLAWLSGSPLMPAARLVTRLMPRTSMPASRAAIASSVVLMPTRSPPSPPAIRTSAASRSAVRGTARRRPRRGRVDLAAMAAAGAVESVRSTKLAPSMGERPVRLMWSLISTGVRGPGLLESAAAVGQHDRPAAGARPPYARRGRRPRRPCPRSSACG